LRGSRLRPARQELTNVELVEDDACATGLPGASFDLVHVRILFARAGQDGRLLAEMARLVRPGGCWRIEEPDSAAWTCVPARPAWARLTNVVRAAFSRGGATSTRATNYGMLRRAGLRDIQVRAAVLALADGHPYRGCPFQLAASLRERILEDHLIDQAELEDVIADCESVAADPGA